MTSSRSDSESSNTSENSNESSSDDREEIRPNVSRFYDVSNDPRRSDVSDHTSDDQPYEEPSSDLEEEEEEHREILVDPSEWCSCGVCVMITDAGTVLYCCCDIGRVEEMKEDKPCITLTDDFTELILNKKVLHLVSYSVNKKGCIAEEETEKFNKMLRFTGYKSFLNLLELNGLGKNRRYGLPACVVHKIRDTYPSANNNYTGFKAAIENKESFGSETLRSF